MVRIAGLVDVWEACKTRMTVRHQAEAEASVASLPPPMNKAEVQVLRVRFEQMHYRLEDKVAPATGTLEQLFEQVEAGEWKSMSLAQFMSREDQDAEPLAAVIDKSGTVRVKKGFGEGRPPKSGEELRQRTKLMAHCYIFCEGSVATGTPKPVRQVHGLLDGGVRAGAEGQGCKWRGGSSPNPGVGAELRLPSPEVHDEGHE